MDSAPRSFHLSARTQALDFSGIRKAFERGAQLKDPINLSIGQPDFPVPEALKKAAESLPTLSALEASSPDSSASSTAFATGAPMISAPEPGATCRMSKRPIKPPETKPSTVLLQETGALSQPSNVEKQVGGGCEK